MDANQLAVLIPIITFVGLFLLIFGIYYLRNKERMAMFERGMEPQTNFTKKQDNRSFSLTFGLLLIGAGLGLFIAYLLDYLVFSSRFHYVDTTAIYFALIAIFGGLGLFISYLIESKSNQKKDF